MSCSSWWRSLVLPWPLHSLVWPQEGARTLVSGWGSLETSSSLPRNCACPGLMPAWGFEGVCPQREGQKLTWRSPAPSFCSPTRWTSAPPGRCGDIRGPASGEQERHLGAPRGHGGTRGVGPKPAQGPQTPSLFEGGSARGGAGGGGGKGSVSSKLRGPGRQSTKGQRTAFTEHSRGVKGHLA